MKILLVDDDIAILHILKDAFDWHSAGIDDVLLAYNTTEARSIITKLDIDIVLCDVEMPKENGLQLLSWVQETHPNIVAIILTGHADFSYARTAVSIGVHEFLLKPVDYIELGKVIRESVKLVNRNLLKDRHRKYGEYLLKKSNSSSSTEKWIDSMIMKIQASTDINDSKSAVKIVQEYIEKHYCESVNRSDLEKLVHLNRDYLNREFKLATGYSLTEYIQVCRILAAKELLTSTSESISVICANIGYDSPPYFSKMFKKWTGMTPAEYRNNVQKYSTDV